MKSIIFTICLLASGFSQAIEEKLYKQHGDYKVFYTAFNTSFLAPDIAVANNIVRGKDKGLVNVALVRQLGVGVEGKVTGTVSNILQQTPPLDLVAVREQNTDY